MRLSFYILLSQAGLLPDGQRRAAGDPDRDPKQRRRRLQRPAGGAGPARPQLHQRQHHGRGRHHPLLPAHRQEQQDPRVRGGEPVAGRQEGEKNVCGKALIFTTFILVSVFPVIFGESNCNRFWSKEGGFFSPHFGFISFDFPLRILIYYRKLKMNTFSIFFHI